MNTIKTGIIQMKNSDSISENRSYIKTESKKLKKEGTQLIILQELHDTKYFCQSENVAHFDLAIPIPSDNTNFYSNLAKETQTVIVTSLFEKRAPGIYHNTAVVFDSDGSIAGKYRKMHIPDDPGYYEKFYFTPGDLGFNPIQTSLGKLGVLICWDQWYPEAARIMTLKGAEILIYPTAIGFDNDDTQAEKSRQIEAWKTIQKSHAIANGIPVITVNRSGFETNTESDSLGISFWGNSFVAGPQGEILFEAGINPISKVIEIDLNKSEQVRRWWPFLRDRRIEDYNEIKERYID